MKNRDKLTRNIIFVAIFLVLFLSAFFIFKIPSLPQEMEVASLTRISTNTTTSPPAITPLPIIATGLEGTPTVETKDTEVISSSSSPSVCAQVWQITPPPILPEWLETPSNADGLFSEVKYVYLAGDLIKHGIVNAGECPNGGLTPDGVSNTCGMEKAFDEVVSWQNQFDPEIYSAALNNQIPAQILKRLFANETQFWPPTEFMPPAYGIGNVTSRGIDPLFKWYEDIYQSTCQDIYSQPCSQQYSSLDSEDSAIFRGSFITKHIDAYCPTCTNEMDLEKIKSSIDYFAKLLVANCKDINESLSLYGFSKNKVTYEDAWRLTLTNYTIGEGCVRMSFNDMDNSVDFSWEAFTQQIDINCGSVQIISNINSITR